MPTKRKTYRKTVKRKPRKQYGGERILTEEELMREATSGLTTENPYQTQQQQAHNHSFAMPPRNDYYITGAQNLKWFAPPILNAVQGNWGQAISDFGHQTKNWIKTHKEAKTVSNTLTKWGLKKLGNWAKSKGWGKKPKAKKKTKKVQKGGMISLGMIDPELLHPRVRLF